VCGHSRVGQVLKTGPCFTCGPNGPSWVTMPEGTSPVREDLTAPIGAQTAQFGDHYSDALYPSRPAQVGGSARFLDWMVQTTDTPSTVVRLGRFAARRLWSHLRGRPLSNLSGDVAGLFGAGIASATTMPVLAMGRDIPDGTMRLREGSLELDWSSGLRISVGVRRWRAGHDGRLESVPDDEHDEDYGGAYG